MMWELVAAGALGGFARAFYGAFKAVARGRKLKFWYFILTVIIGAILGAVIGSLFNYGKAVSGLVGYVGTDILENILKGVVPSQLNIITEQASTKGKTKK